jgi:hypothetical protein
LYAIICKQAIGSFYRFVNCSLARREELGGNSNYARLSERSK